MEEKTILEKENVLSEEERIDREFAEKVKRRRKEAYIETLIQIATFLVSYLIFVLIINFFHLYKSVEVLKVLIFPGYFIALFVYAFVRHIMYLIRRKF